jgi:hypothetical protein
MDQSTRSLDEIAIENISTIIKHYEKSSRTKIVDKQSDPAGSKNGRSPTQQELIEGLYQSCIALEKDNRYLYVLLARAHHKIRWHEDQQAKYKTERDLVIKVITEANQAISRLTSMTSRGQSTTITQ